MGLALSGDAVIRTAWPSCARCGRVFAKKTTRGRSQRFCSRKCAGLHRTADCEAKRQALREQWLQGECRACGTAFTRLVPNHAFCSDVCRRNKTQRSANCLICGKAYLVRGGVMGRPRRYCSLACRQMRPETEAERAARKICKLRRKARKRQVLAERVDPIVVFQRDGWRCRLCGVSTPRRLRATHHPHAPELDHIKALANGGPHTWANVQCLCRSCNIKKGTRDLGQYRLAI